MRAAMLTVHGHALPSARITARTKWTPTARRYLAWQQTVADYCVTLPADSRGFREAITLGLTFYFCKRKHGDLTNLVKAVEDGLQHGGLIVNDKAVRELHARIAYCEFEAHERVEIIIQEGTP